MIVLDENFGDVQREQLRRWRIRFRHIGTDVGRRGMLDTAIVPLLHQLTRPTLITHDRHFYDRDLRHRHYGVVRLDVTPAQLPRFTRRLLRHPRFRTQAQRQGCVIHVGYEGIRFRSLDAEIEEELAWLD